MQIAYEEKDETVETSFCDETRQSSDFLRPSDSVSLKRGFVMNGSPSPILSNARRIGESNTLPLLRHSDRRDPCLDDADWEAVPAPDSEKFI